MILVTGASGFVGQQLCSELGHKGVDVRAAVRTLSELDGISGAEQVIINNIGMKTQWHESLKGVDCVVHLAARVHAVGDNSNVPLAEFRAVNVNATRNLAKQAAAAGVKRFIYISSIKVNGEETLGTHKFTADDEPAPIDPYAISKYEAELALQKISAMSGMDVVIIRPPLVYGPGVKGNFNKMMRWLVKGVPLPFGMVRNSRSFVALDNLIDFIIICITHPSAPGEVFLISDGDDMSTTALLEKLSNKLCIPTRLIPVPIYILKFIAFVLGKKTIARRLLGSLKIDISKNRDVLGWTPPHSVDKVLKATADDFYKKNMQ